MNNHQHNINAWITPSRIQIVSAVIIACGLLLVGMNFLTLATTVTHRATIVELVTTNEGIEPVVTFERHTDETVTRQIEPLKYPSRVSVGDEVKIYYYAEYSSHIKLTTFWEFWLWAVVLLIVGAFGSVISCGLWFSQRHPKKQSQRTSAEASSLLRQIKPTDPETRIAWDYIIEAVTDKHITLEMLLESLNTLDGKSGVNGWDEFGIDEDDVDPSRAIVYYAAFQEPAVCPKADLLAAYHQLVQIMK